ncbi:MAG: hypothetical protein IKL52_06095 [Candidatus Gastranaerophilales bacterium]|nr:hypothetical protein [Candidatus Gastranaerophilales bacterium]
MLLDSQNLFSENQEITTGTIYSQNIIDFGKNDVSFVPVIIQVVSDFTGLTSLAVKVQTSSSANFDEVIDLIESKLEVEKLKAGAKFPINYLPKGNLGFMRLAYVVEGSETTGKITAGVVAGDGLSAHEV